MRWVGGITSKMISSLVVTAISRFSLRLIQSCPIIACFLSSVFKITCALPG